MTVPDTWTPFDEAGEAFVMLSRRAWATNLDRAERLVQAATSASVSDAPGAGERATSLHEAGDLAHQIVGSAGTFGFDEVSDLARRIETRLTEDPPDVEALLAAAVDVRAALLLRQPDPAP